MNEFRLHVPLSCWQKAGDEHAMRVGGIVSTEQLDQQQEVVVSKGLDFQPFLKSGWFNDNHGQRTIDVLGYPTEVKRIKKGVTLPDGSVSESGGWWTEGYLIDTDEGRRVFNLCTALQKTDGGRKLGFSIEGKVKTRAGDDPKRITSAEVRNVAITHCPVNRQTGMVALAKAMTAGYSMTAAESQQPKSGEGFPARKESLDPELYDQIDYIRRKKKKKKKSQEEGLKLTKSSAALIVAALKPQLTHGQILSIVGHALAGR